MVKNGSETNESEYIEGVEKEDFADYKDYPSTKPKRHEKVKSMIHGSDFFSEMMDVERKCLVVGGKDLEKWDVVRSSLSNPPKAAVIGLKDIETNEDKTHPRPLAFEILSEMATLIIGIFEDYDGGRVWELSTLYRRQSSVRGNLWMFKKAYDDEDVQHKKYDNGEAASRLTALEGAVGGRVKEWRKPDEVGDKIWDTLYED